MNKDYLIGAFVGLLTGILALRIFSFLNIDFSFRWLFFIVLVPILWALGVWLGKFLSRWFPFFAQFGKFATIGFLSTSIDFFILNLMSNLTGVTAGIVVGWINIPGFLIAVFNAYLWNKLWVFKQIGDELFGNFFKFLGVTLIGLFINSGIIIFITSFPSSFDSTQWLNMAKISATIFSMVWNFIGYKFLVFKKNV